MNAYHLIAGIVTLSLILGYLNHRFIHMQTTIAMMISSLLIACALIISNHYHWNHWHSSVTHLINHLDFGKLLLNGMLGLLLFAGAFAIDIEQLKRQRTTIAVLASLSTIVSTALVSIGSWWMMKAFHIPFPWLYACLFGALISPTDPIAVLSTFRRIKAPKSLTACVAGESLFNDGVGIVIFLTLYELLNHQGTLSTQHVLILFIRQALGGLAYGYIIGKLSCWLIRPLKDVSMIILITLAITTGAYTLADTLGISGPLAMVVASILVGSQLRQKKAVYSFVASFWLVVDELLNIILFVLLGFELLAVNFHGNQLLINICVIAMTLIIRLITVATPLTLLQSRKKRQEQPWMITILTWGGLRGSLAVALALSLPDSVYRQIILSMTYGVVVFSVVIQGLSIAPLARLASKAHAKRDLENANAN